VANTPGTTDVTAPVSGPLKGPPLQSPQTPQNISTVPGPTQTPQPLVSAGGRMVTRVSSGAIRHKSVGELLGERDVALCLLLG
jgi:hypothetical protein